MTASVGGSDIPYHIEDGEVPQSATNSSLGRQYYMYWCMTADHAILCTVVRNFCMVQISLFTAFLCMKIKHENYVCVNVLATCKCKNLYP